MKRAYWEVIFYGECHNCGLVGHTQGACPKNGKGFKGNCDSCGIPGHTRGQCPKFPYGKGKGGKGGLNSLDGSEEQMNLGAGEERQEDQEPVRERKGAKTIQREQHMRE